MVKLGVASTSGGQLQWIDTTKYTEYLIVNVGWSPAGRVVFHVQDRQQTWLDFNLADAATGSAQTLFRETTRAWVERWQDSSADALWLKDGSFLWLSERSGWRHFITTPRRPAHQAGDQRRREIRDHLGRIRQAWIYFTSTTSSPVGLDLYRVRLNGTELQRVSTRTASTGRFESVFHAVSGFNSDLNTPPQVRLHVPTRAR